MPPVTTLCIYRVKPGREAEFLQLLEKHWPALAQAGLVTETPSVVERTVDRQGHVVFVERFSWRDEQAPAEAHDSQDVMAVWGPMDPLTVSMEFFDVQPVPLQGRR